MRKYLSGYLVIKSEIGLSLRGSSAEFQGAAYFLDYAVSGTPVTYAYAYALKTVGGGEGERTRRASRIAIHYLAAISVASWRGRRSLRAAPSRESLAYLNATQHI